jgi:Pyruvate/2-oxoacid:ferredoxin oxidoreductase delta subunit
MAILCIFESNYQILLLNMGKSYENLLIIYYSGTGNSKRVSEWIVEKAKEQGLRTHFVSFHQFNPDDIAGFTGKTLIGFFSATHGFNMPHSMLRFLFRFKLLKGSDVFIGNTRAGMKLGKLFLPGLSGIAMYFPALIMFFKGYKVKAMYPVDLPSNWISLHPGLRKKIIDSMVEHYERLTKNFAVKILAGKSVFLKSFVLLPLDILVAPIAFGYYFVGRYILAKTFVANYNCNNCMVCIEQCPTKSIILSGNRPYWKFTCESCMKCMNYCPHRAIETAHSFVFVLVFLLTVFVNPWLSGKVTELVAVWLGHSWMAYKVLLFIVQWGIWIVTFYLGYKFIHYLMRFPKLNKIFTYASLTTWKFWRRYKIPNPRVSARQSGV